MHVHVVLQQTHFACVRLGGIVVVHACARNRKRSFNSTAPHMHTYIPATRRSCICKPRSWPARTSSDPSLACLPSREIICVYSTCNFELPRPPPAPISLPPLFLLPPLAATTRRASRPPSFSGGPTSKKRRATTVGAQLGPSERPTDVGSACAVRAKSPHRPRALSALLRPSLLF